MPREVFIENERDRMVKRFDWRAIALRERESSCCRFAVSRGLPLSLWDH